MYSYREGSSSNLVTKYRGSSGFGRYRKQKSKVSPAIRREITRISKRVYNKRTELKYFMTGASASIPTVGGSIVDLTAIPQSVSDTDCTGDSLWLRNISLRAFTALNVVANLAGSVRIVLFQWFDDTTPTVSVILNAGAINPMVAPYNHDTNQKFSILYDATVGVSSGNLYDSYTNCLVKPTKGRVDYSNGTTTGVNKVYMLFVTDTATTLSFTYTAQVQYNDA